MATSAPSRELVIRPLTAGRVDDLKSVTAGTWGSACWDLWPRYRAKEMLERGLDGDPKTAQMRRRAEVARLAKRKNAPGLIAYRGGEPIGWVSIGPRFDYARIVASRATPPVVDLAVWVIPCITVRRGNRGRGLAIAMIKAAIAYAAKHGRACGRGVSPHR